MECTNYFMQKEAYRFDPAFESAVIKYSERQQALNASTFQRVKPHRDRFKKFLGNFTKHAKDKEIRRFDIDRRFRWDDVQAEANAALEAYTTQVTFRSQSIRYLSRSFTQSASTLEAFLHFVPDGEFTFIICGALTLVFNAAKRMANLRQRILGCLDSLPRVVTQARIYRKLYNDDPDLWQAAETLYLGILDGIEAMLSWMDESAFKKTVKSLFLQNSYGKSIEDQAIKAGIEDSANEFRQFAEICLHKAICRQGELLARMYDDFVNQLTGQEADCAWRIATTHAQILIQNTPVTDVASLQKAISIDPNLLGKDINEAVSNAQRISSGSSLANAMTLVQYPQFKNWFQSNTSNILLVNGHMQLSHEQEGASPLTVVSWVLYGMLAANNDVLPLFHLCGQHIQPGDAFWGLAGTLRCLNAQLLSANPGSANTVSLDDNFIRSLELRDINILCQLLHILVPKSSKKAVYILIDGFTIAEGSTSQANVSILSQALGFLVNELNWKRQMNLPGPVVKVLITTPTASVYLGPLLYGRNGACILDLPETGPVGGYGMNMFQDFSGYI